MGTPPAGAVVLVRFPFSDLSRSKLRPAIVLAGTGRGDAVLCQVTSKSYGDEGAVTIESTDLTTGSLRVTSFARPGKIFTANEAIITTTVGTLTPESSSLSIVCVFLQRRPSSGPRTVVMKSRSAPSAMYLRIRRRISSALPTRLAAFNLDSDGDH